MHARSSSAVSVGKGACKKHGGSKKACSLACFKAWKLERSTPATQGPRSRRARALTVSRSGVQDHHKVFARRSELRGWSQSGEDDHGGDGAQAFAARR
eukprot:2129655-Rhodomonas_salina.2